MADRTGSLGDWSGIVTRIVSGKRRYLALFFPFLPADRLRRNGASPDGAFAFVEKLGGAICLVAVDRQALALGLVPGCTLADARASAPDLAVFDHDPGADHRLIERIADGCERYSPMVAIDPPDGLLIDISGCDHLFGGEAGLVCDIEERLAQMGITVRTALAHSPEAAHALARFQTLPAPDEETAIRRLTVSALELEDEIETGLRRAGIRTIADLADLPSASLAARFGKAMVYRLDRVTGRSDSRITPRRPLAPLRVERRFAEPLGHVDAALSVLVELAGEAAGQLQERGMGGRDFHARFFRSDGIVRDIKVETGQRESLALPSEKQFMELVSPRRPFGDTR